MRRLSLLALVFVVVLAACGMTSEVPIEEEGDVAEEITVEEEQVGTTLSSDDAGSEDDPSEEDGAGVLEIATLLPVESGTFEGQHWIKWKLDAPIADPAKVHITYQLNIRSAEDDVFGVGWTIPVDEEPFASGFCLDDRPNCADGIVPVGVDIGPEGDELIFRIPEGTFGNATGLRFGAFIQTFASADANPVTEDVADGAVVPLGTEEGDPC